MATGLKELIQAMQLNDGGVHEGIVIQTSPIKIKLVNVDNYTITSNMVTVPKELTDYTVNATISGLQECNGNCTITINNALKAGDNVIILGYNKNKSFVVLGRK